MVRVSFGSRIFLFLSAHLCESVKLGKPFCRGLPAVALGAYKSTRLRTARYILHLPQTKNHYKQHVVGNRIRYDNRVRYAIAFARRAQELHGISFGQGPNNGISENFLAFRSGRAQTMASAKTMIFHSF